MRRICPIFSVRSIIVAAHWALLGGLLLLGGILAVRRLARGTTIPLDTWPLAFTGAALAASCLLARWLSGLLPPGYVNRPHVDRPHVGESSRDSRSRLGGTRPRASRAPAWLHHLTRLAPLAACALLVAGVLLPGTPLAGACLLVTLLAVEETWSLTRLSRSSSIEGVEAGAQAGAWDESLDQQLTRRQVGGEDVLSGQVRVRFAAGQRTAEAHVAFCPPFQRQPRVEHEAVAGPDARIELGQLLPLGARFDVKLARAAAKDEALLIGFTAAALDGDAAARAS